MGNYEMMVVSFWYLLFVGLLVTIVTVAWRIMKAQESIAKSLEELSNYFLNKG